MDTLTSCLIIIFKNSSKKWFLRTVFKNYSMKFYKTKVKLEIFLIF